MFWGNIFTYIFVIIQQQQKLVTDWVLKMCFPKCEEVVFTSLGMPDNYENLCYFFQKLFFGCHFITSNQISLEDLIDSSVFYLVRGVEVAIVKSVWKKQHQLVLSSF